MERKRERYSIKTYYIPRIHLLNVNIILNLI